MASQEMRASSCTAWRCIHEKTRLAGTATQQRSSFAAPVMRQTSTMRSSAMLSSTTKPVATGPPAAAFFASRRSCASSSCADLTASLTHCRPVCTHVCSMCRQCMACTFLGACGGPHNGKTSSMTHNAGRGLHSAGAQRRCRFEQGSIRHGDCCTCRGQCSRRCAPATDL